MVNFNPANQLRFLQSTPYNPNRPLFIYLPGMDGSGLLLRSQIPALESKFEIRCVSIPVTDRSGWIYLAKQVIELLEQERTANPRRSIYLCGESFGGCLAMQVMVSNPQLFTRIILINPASAFHLRPWLHWASQYTNFIPAFVYSLTTTGFISILASLPRIPPENRDLLFQVINSIPPPTVFWRIEMLRNFSIPPEQLRRIYKPILLVASGGDRLLPSIAEAQRLTELFPNASISILPNSGHACLIEGEVNLYEIIKQADFLDD